MNKREKHETHKLGETRVARIARLEGYPIDNLIAKEVVQRRKTRLHNIMEDGAVEYQPVSSAGWAFKYAQGNKECKKSTLWKLSFSFVS